MISIYVVVGVVVAAICIAFFRHYKKTRHHAIIMSSGIVVLSLLALNMYVMPYYYAATYESTIREKYPVFDLIAEHSPHEFHAYIAKVKHNLLKRDNENNDIFYTAELLDSQFLKYAPFATNGSLYQFLKTELSADKKLYQIDPKLVLIMEFPEKFKNVANPSVLSKRLDDQAVEDLLNAKEDVIRSAIEDKQPSLTKNEMRDAMAMITAITDNLLKKYDAKTIRAAFNTPADPAVDKKIAAEVLISYYEEILAKGEKNAGLILKASVLKTPSNNN